jgi:adenosylcobinamide-phosphate synthase
LEGFLVILAFGLDWLVGDPRWFPHPVRGIGWLISQGEKRLPLTKIGGVVLVGGVVGGTFLLAWATIKLSEQINLPFSYLISTILIFMTLSLKDLKVSVREVKDQLAAANLFLARQKVGLIVGRDTEALSEVEIIRACVETVAESTVDGIISPLFYAFLGGAPLALAYKAVNTLDSMVGYKNERYFHFGWAAAKLDDLANFIPARLAVFFLLLVTFKLKKIRTILKIVLRDGKKHPSPNSGLIEAGFAGALSVQLGGVNTYQGRREERPLLGDKKQTLRREHLEAALELMERISLLGLIGLGLVSGGIFNIILPYVLSSIEKVMR